MCYKHKTNALEILNSDRHMEVLLLSNCICRNCLLRKILREPCHQRVRLEKNQTHTRPTSGRKFDIDNVSELLLAAACQGSLCFFVSCQPTLPACNSSGEGMKFFRATRAEHTCTARSVLCNARACRVPCEAYVHPSSHATFTLRHASHRFFD